jgi:hypothetical protein
MPDIGQEMGIDPRATAASTGARIVPTVWAQRALNAAGVRTDVDGIAGSATLRGLVSAWTAMGRSGAQPVLVDAAHVAISPGFEGRLSLLRRVADPAGSTCGPCQWSACSSGAHPSTPSTSPATTPSTPAGPIVTQEPTVIEPGGGRSFISATSILPWVIGGTALAGLGFWFLMGGGAGSRVRANRRRSSRRPRSSMRRNSGGRVWRNRITSRQRAKLPKSAFVFPERRAWPMNNARRAYAAIQYLRMGRVGSASEFSEIRNAIIRRYPDVWAIYGKNLTWERSKAAKAKRRSTKARRRTSRGTRRRIAANRRR